MARINYHHLYYFWQVAKEGKLTQAADNLCLSQSALSTQIKQLEDRLNIHLFEKKGRNLQLTEQGQQVFSYAQEIFKKGEELEQQIERGFLAENQTIRIGILATMSRNFVEQFIAPLRNMDKVSYLLHSYGQANLLNELANHQLDIALTNMSVAGTDTQLWQAQLLSRQPVAVVGPPDLNLPDRFNEKFGEHAWVLPLDGNPIRSAFDRFCAQYQFQPKVIAQTDDMAMLRLLARDNQAMTVLPEVVVQDELTDKRLVRYLTLPQSFENFYAITTKRQFPNPTIFRLIDKYLARQHLVKEASYEWLD